MRKYLLGFIISLALITGTNNAALADFVPDSSEVYTGNGEIFETETGLQDYTTDTDISRISNGSLDAEHGGAFRLRNLAARIIDFMERMIVPVAIIFLLWSAFSLLFQRGDEAQFQQRIRQILWTGVGFAIFVFAYAIVDRMFFGVDGSLFEGDGVGILGNMAVAEVKGLINFLSTFAVAIGVAFLTFGAVRLILLGEKEEEQSRIRRQILFAIIGIIMIGFAQTIANVFFAGSPGGNLSIDSTELIRGIVGWTNTLLGFVSLGAVVVIIWAGIQMIMHFGNEEIINKSKKIILYAIIALVLAFSAFSIVRIFVTPGLYGDTLLESNTSQLQPFDRVVPAP